MIFGAISLLANEVGDLINPGLLDSRAIDHAHNCQDAFPNFCLEKKKIYTATEKWNISYN